MTKRSRRTVAVKGSRRVRIVNTIADHLTGDLFLKKLNWRKATEQRIKLALHPDLQAKVQQIYENVFGYTEGYANEQAQESVLFEQIVSQTINNLQFLGSQHRPDFEVQFNDFNIALEVKKGKTGSAVRAGIGQAIVYTTKYDFVIYLFVDTSEGAKIKRSRNGRKERYVLNSLWENYNIHFSVLA